MIIHHQSVFEKWPIEDKSIQAVITSPPYWGLRKYHIPDVIIGGWKGQHGLEPDYKLYLAHCKLWMQEVIRVVRDDGIIFINLGDSFSTVSGGMAQGKWGKLGKSLKDNVGVIKQTKQQGYPQKSKLLIPERFSIMCVDELGLICRNHIVWAKPNGMPESVTDRFSKKWESIFMFVKQPKYYFNLDDVREKAPPLNRWGGDKLIAKGKSIWDEGTKQSAYRDRNMQPNDGMKNPGDVWNIPETQFRLRQDLTDDVKKNVINKLIERGII